MERRKFLKTTGAAGLLALMRPSGILTSFARPPLSDPSHVFLHPPHNALPQTLWFWMNGHVSKQGITLDLEAMKRAGLGGVFNFDAGTGIPIGPVAYLSAEWIALKKHAIMECARLGLDFTMHNCPGWSSSGGPWITTELSMQQFTWSEAVTSGGKPIRIRMPKPFHKLNYYRDVALLAFPCLAGEEQYNDLRVLVNGTEVDKKLLTGEEGEGLAITPRQNGGGRLDLQFKFPFAARSVTFLVSSLQEGMIDGRRTSVLLEASDDGMEFQAVATINTGSEYELSLGNKFITFDLPLTTARFFRLNCSEPRRISQFRLSSIVRLKNFLEKTGARYMFGGEKISVVLDREMEGTADPSVILLDQVHDLTGQMNAGGWVEWLAPPGNWTLLRIGYTPTGSITKAAPATGVGLECDKFNAAAIDFHFKKMIERLLPVMKQLPPSTRMGLEIDSYEAGPQTWTENFPEAFKQYRKYDMIRYLPALTGRVLQNNDITERFLWDFRRTQADLIADNYYGRFHQLCREHAVDAYVEPYDKGPFEEMQIGARSGSVMGEFWNGLSSILQGNYAIRRTTKLAASISHINGFSITGAEAFTSEPGSAKWQEYPFALKGLGDRMFCRGINRMVMHRFAHQPHPSAAPGMTMGPWGIQFDRTNTWFEKGKAWMKYLSRSQALLQQGVFVADLLYFTGEEVNIYTRVEREDIVPSPPKGFDYDVINAEGILKDLRIENGKIVLSVGMTYRVLVLQDFGGISLSLLKQLYGLVRQGMILVGKRPEHSLGLTDYRNDDEEFQKLAGQLWANSTVRTEVGEGVVYPVGDLHSAISDLRLHPDFAYTSASGDAPLEYIHRRAGDADIYFLSNQRRSYESLVCSFRVAGKQPELWDAVTGKSIPQKVFKSVDDRTRVPVQLAPYGSVFVIFRSSDRAEQITSIEKDGRMIMDTEDFIPMELAPLRTTSFTILFWAKPEIEVMTVPSTHMGNLKYPWTEYFAVYPSTPGQEFSRGTDGCAGVAVGRNGVVVWENAKGHPLPVLTAITPIEGWTHIAIVYRESTPSIYVGGKMVNKGKQSNNDVHPPLLPASGPGQSYYNGDKTETELIGRALSDEEIQSRAAAAPDFYQPSPFEVEPVCINGTSSLLVHHNGHYKVGW
ncbi:MAG TPA: glycosyl hydrolase, partial [Flavisolibacter sp.]|nr:glycosyl hydrolase [Flavisolibacter sp.]